MEAVKDNAGDPPVLYVQVITGLTRLSRGCFFAYSWEICGEIARKGRTDVSPCGRFSCIMRRDPSAQLFQQAGAARQHIPVGVVKISGVPGVGDVAAGSGVVQQQAELVLGVAPQEPVQIAEILPVHGDEQVELAVVLGGHLPRPVIPAGDPRLPELSPGAGVDAFADGLPAGGGGVDIDLLLEPGPADQVLHDVFRHGAAADVAVADE